MLNQVKKYQSGVIIDVDSSTPSTSAIQGSKRTGTPAHTATETTATKRQKSTNYSRREDDTEELSTELQVFLSTV